MKNTTRKLTNQIKNQSINLTVLLIFLCCKAEAKSICQNSAIQFTVETNRVWINVTDAQGAFSQTLMGYRADATDGVDHGLDGAYMNDGAIALASLIGDARYAIQFRGLPFSATDVVPLSFSASYEGTYTFAIDHMDGFFINSSFPVFIHDKLTNTYNNLKTGTYTFTSGVGLYNNRFELTYMQPLTSLGASQNTFTVSDLDVYQNNGRLIINAGAALLKNIAIYSINGQLLYQNNEVNASLATIAPPSSNQQPIIIKVTTVDGITVAKKWLCF